MAVLDTKLELIRQYKVRRAEILCERYGDGGRTMRFRRTPPFNNPALIRGPAGANLNGPNGDVEYLNDYSYRKKPRPGCR